MRRFSSCVFKAMVAAKNRHQNSVAGICRATLTTIALVLSTLVGVIDAQSSNGLAGLPIRSAADVTFALLARSPSQQDYQTEQVRRFIDKYGQLVEMSEELTVQSNQAGSSRFRLQLIAAGSSDVSVPSVAPSQQWTRTYQSNAGLLHQHGSFRVHDPLAAAANYRIFDFGASTRAARNVRRVVVYPLSGDKAIWLLDIDTQTGLVLYSAEYDAAARLLSELEVMKLEVGSSQVTQTPGWNWQPQLTITDLATQQEVTQRIRSGLPTMPAVASIIPEYVLSRTHVSENPLNQDQVLVFTYTDGIDEFFVSEAFGSQDPFAGTPVTLRNVGQHSHTIASYDDPGLRAYVFHEAGTTFQVVGRNSLRRLQGVARRVCQQAVVGS